MVASSAHEQDTPGLARNAIEDPCDCDVVGLAVGLGF